MMGTKSPNKRVKNISIGDQWCAGNTDFDYSITGGHWVFEIIASTAVYVGYDHKANKRTFVNHWIGCKKGMKLDTFSLFAFDEKGNEIGGDSNRFILTRKSRGHWEYPEISTRGVNDG